MADVLETLVNLGIVALGTGLAYKITNTTPDQISSCLNDIGWYVNSALGQYLLNPKFTPLIKPILYGASGGLITGGLANLVKKSK